MKLYTEASAFEGAAIVAMIQRRDEEEGTEQKILQITMEDGITLSVELDPAEKRLNELGYRQELRRSLRFLGLYAVGVSFMTVFAGFVPTYAYVHPLLPFRIPLPKGSPKTAQQGSSGTGGSRPSSSLPFPLPISSIRPLPSTVAPLSLPLCRQGFINGGPAGLIWYWWITALFVHLIGLSMAEIASSFPWPALPPPAAAAVSLLHLQQPPLPAGVRPHRHSTFGWLASSPAAAPPSLLVCDLTATAPSAGLLPHLQQPPLPAGVRPHRHSTFGWLASSPAAAPPSLLVCDLTATAPSAGLLPHLQQPPPPCWCATSPPQHLRLACFLTCSSPPLPAAVRPHRHSTFGWLASSPAAAPPPCWCATSPPQHLRLACFLTCSSPPLPAGVRPHLYSTFGWLASSPAVAPPPCWCATSPPEHVRLACFLTCSSPPLAPCWCATSPPQHVRLACFLTCSSPPPSLLVCDLTATARSAGLLPHLQQPPLPAGVRPHRHSTFGWLASSPAAAPPPCCSPPSLLVCDLTATARSAGLLPHLQQPPPGSLLVCNLTATARSAGLLPHLQQPPSLLVCDLTATARSAGLLPHLQQPPPPCWCATSPPQHVRLACFLTCSSPPLPAGVRPHRHSTFGWLASSPAAAPPSLLVCDLTATAPSAGLLPHLQQPPPSLLVCDLTATARSAGLLPHLQQPPLPAGVRPHRHSSFGWLASSPAAAPPLPAGVRPHRHSTFGWLASSPAAAPPPCWCATSPPQHLRLACFLTCSSPPPLPAGVRPHRHSTFGWLASSPAAAPPSLLVCDLTATARSAGLLPHLQQPPLPAGVRPHCRSTFGWLASSPAAAPPSLLVCDLTVTAPSAGMPRHSPHLLPGGANGGGYLLSQYAVFAIACGFVLICFLINCLSVRTVATVMVVSATIQIAAAVVLIIMLPLVAPTHKPASWVFGDFGNNRDITLTPSNAYSFLITLLVSQYSLYGYDCVAHLAEETKKADRTAPLAIMSSLTTVTVLAWLLVVVLTWSIQDPAHLFAAESVTGGMQPVVQIMWDVFYARYGSGLGAQVFTVVICISFFGATLSCQLGASRVAYALARDGGLPFSSLWRRLASNRVPIWTLTLSVLVGLLFLLPVLASSTLFFALASISTIAWISAYAIPILFRALQKEQNFQPGPFYLPNYIGFTAGKLVHVVALLWVLYTLVVFNLPTIKEELVSVMEWKLTRGKWRPRLLDFIKHLNPKAVQTASSRAFAALASHHTPTTPGSLESGSGAGSEAGIEASLKAAVTELSTLKGVGAATASAVLAAFVPQVAPFMSDEAMVAALGDCKDYSLRRYLVFAKAMREKASTYSSSRVNTVRHQSLTRLRTSLRSALTPGFHGIPGFRANPLPRHGACQTFTVKATYYDEDDEDLFELTFLQRLQRAWRIIFPPRNRPPSNAEIAKERLRLVLYTDRGEVSPEVRRRLRRKIIDAISAYVEIESEEDVQLSVSADPDIGTVYSITIPVRRVKPEYQEYWSESGFRDRFYEEILRERGPNSALTKLEIKREPTCSNPPAPKLAGVLRRLKTSATATGSQQPATMATMAMMACTSPPSNTPPSALRLATFRLSTKRRFRRNALTPPVDATRCLSCRLTHTHLLHLLFLLLSAAHQISAHTPHLDDSRYTSAIKASPQPTGPSPSHSIRLHVDPNEPDSSQSVRADARSGEQTAPLVPPAVFPRLILRRRKDSKPRLLRSTRAKADGATDPHVDGAARRSRDLKADASHMRLARETASTMAILLYRRLPPNPHTPRGGFSVVAAHGSSDGGESGSDSISNSNSNSCSIGSGSGRGVSGRGGLPSPFRGGLPSPFGGHAAAESEGEEASFDIQKVVEFTLADLVAATDGFADKNHLGQGSYGNVYRGRLKSGEVVAVKRAKAERRQDMRKFKKE
ncbi:unnamed protein product, partial [Closterium sp. Yama58-4]